MVVFAKKELFEINGFLTWFFRCCGAVCVRGTKDEMAAIEQTVEEVEEINPDETAGDDETIINDEAAPETPAPAPAQAQPAAK